MLTVRKIGAPFHEELAIGAVASGGLVVLNDEVIAQLRRRASRTSTSAPAVALRQLADQEAALPARPPGRPSPAAPSSSSTTAWPPARRCGPRSGRAHGRAGARSSSPCRSGRPTSCAELAALADEVVCPLQPADFSAVGQWYVDFSATTDADVLRLLAPG